MSDIQNAASSIVSRVQTVESTTGTLIDAVKHDSLLQKHQLLGTLQLMYSDLLAEVMQSPTHKLFYGQTLSTQQLDYLTILQSELNKLNNDNNLLERG